MSLIRLSVIFGLALGIPAHLSAAPSPVNSGTISKGCRTLGEAKLCFEPLSEDTPQDIILLVGGKKTDLLFGGFDKFLPYEIDRRNGVYRVNIGTRPSASDIPFFASSEIRFRKVGSRYLATKYAVASEFKCDDRPNPRRIDEIDFDRRTITTILEPAWTDDGKGRRYVYPIKLQTSDIHKLTAIYLAEFIENTPANRNLCKDYDG